MASMPHKLKASLLLLGALLHLGLYVVQVNGVLIQGDFGPNNVQQDFKFVLTSLLPLLPSVIGFMALGVCYFNNPTFIAEYGRMFKQVIALTSLGAVFFYGIILMPEYFFHFVRFLLMFSLPMMLTLGLIGFKMGDYFTRALSVFILSLLFGLLPLGPISVFDVFFERFFFNFAYIIAAAAGAAFAASFLPNTSLKDESNG